MDEVSAYELAETMVDTAYSIADQEIRKLIDQRIVPGERRIKALEEQVAELYDLVRRRRSLLYHWRGGPYPSTTVHLSRDGTTTLCGKPFVDTTLPGLLCRTCRRIDKESQTGAG